MALLSFGKQLLGVAAMSATEGSHPSEAVQQAPGLWRTDLQQQDLSVPGARWSRRASTWPRSAANAR